MNRVSEASELEKYNASRTYQHASFFMKLGRLKGVREGPEQPYVVDQDREHQLIASEEGPFPSSTYTIYSWPSEFIVNIFGTPNWEHKIREAKTPEEIIAIHREPDIPVHNKIADRLVELQNYHEENPDEEEPLTLEALRELALFFFNNPSLPFPHISFFPNDEIYLEWKLQPQGRVAAQLSPHKKLVNFAAIEKTFDPEEEREEVNGFLPEAMAISNITYFTDKKNEFEDRRPPPRLRSFRTILQT